MKHQLRASFALASIVMATAASAAVTVTRVDGTVTTPWATTFGSGNRVAFAVASSGSGVGEGLTNSQSFAQSFQGNGQVIEGFGFVATSSNASSLNYTISLVDYGTSAVVDTATEFQAASTTLVTATFAVTNMPSSQLYFDFTSADTVTLVNGRSYGMILSTSASGSGALIYRLGGGDSTYAGGTAAKGATSALNPDSFAGAGALRDAGFALYTATAAVPEPSSFAALAGAMTLGFAGLRRRRAAR